MKSVQNYVKEYIVTELKNKLQTDLGIESLYIKPFNVIQLNGVYLKDKNDSIILKANTIYADFDLLPLSKKELVFNAARLSDFEINLSKDSAQAPLNIQFIIDAFKPKKESNNKKIQVQINSVDISDGNFRYDIYNQQHTDQKFDPNHINVTDLNGKLALKSLEPDSLNIQIKKLNLKEKSGLTIDNLIVRIITQKNHLYIKGFKLNLPKSQLQLNKFEVNYADTTQHKPLIDRAVFDIQVAPSSYIALKDISPLVPAFKHFEDRILFKTNIKGTINSISVSDLTLDYGDYMHLTATGTLNNIRDKDKLWIAGYVNNLTINESGISQIINNFSANKKQQSEILNRLGTLSFKGNIIGFLKDFKAVGKFTSRQGEITSSLDFGFNPNEYTSSFFRGKISTSNFRLGDLLNNKDIDDLSFDLSVNVNKPKKGYLNGDVNGIINKFIYKKYIYHDIKLAGKYDGLKINGGLSLNDENAIFNLNGLFDLSKKDPELIFAARLKNIRFDKLNLSNKYKDSYLSLVLDANFTGKNIDDIQGYIEADSIRFLQSDKRFKMDKFIVEASGIDDQRKLKVKSDIINGEVLGDYSFSTIAESMKESFNQYLPSLINYQKKKKSIIKKNDLTLNFTINNTEAASDIFQLPVTIFSPTKIVGFYNNQIDRFKLELFMPSLKAAGTQIQSGYFAIENDDREIKSNISGTFITKKQTLNNLSSDLTISNDIININTLFLNKDESKLRSKLSNSIVFSRTDKKALETQINFNNGELVLNNTLWNIYDSHINITSDYINVDNFKIASETKDQSLKINGTFSQKDPSAKLFVNLQKIDLDYVFNTLAIDALQFGGSADGELVVSTIDGQPYPKIDLNVTNFAFNNTLLGKLKLESDLDTQTKKVNMSGLITNADEKETTINGYINPITQELSLDFDSKAVNVAFLNKYVSTLFNNVQGTGYGKVRLFGDFSNVTVEGKAYIENGGLGINFLNTYYTFSDTVYMKNDLIYFKDIAFHDQYNNTALMSGKVAHNFFTDFMYYVDLKGDNFMLYNAIEKMNPMLYGKVFGSGTGVIKGDEKAVDINVNMKTDPNTSIYMNFMEETVENYSFVRYKTPEENNDSILQSNNEDKFKLSRIKTDSGIEINMDFYIDATPDASVELLMDPVGGDRIKGTGSGALRFTWGTNKPPMLYGTYQINKGSYNFTFQKILERKFTIQDGSTVQFVGDPFQALLNITAVYRIVANLNDLDQNLAQTTGQSSIPVNCLLNITGPLRRPNISLDIALPSADPEVQRQVKSLMSTEDMINRQIVYLLLLSKFYTPNYAVTEQRTSDLAAVASATLSAQLSNILSQLDDRWQIGTNIRTSDSDFSSTEVELILSSRLLNDRVLFNGNFGYRDNPMTNDAFIGDVDIEVLLNRLGTWRLKAYNHYNEKYYYVGANGGSGVQTQGIGILYKKDFDNLRELFGRPKKVKKESSKEDSVPKLRDMVKMKK